MPIIIDYAVEVRPIAVSNLIYRAGLLLQDEDHVRWTNKELIEWINDAVSAVIRMKPAAGARRALFGLVPGARQELDGSVVQLIDIVCNVGADDVTPGRAIRKTERHLLDSTNPDWYSMKQSSTVRHYTYDDRMPSIFFVYPPAASGAKVEIIHAVMPDEVVEEDENLAINIEYTDVILSYVMFRCLSKDSEYANAAMATGYYQAFTASLGAGEAGEQATTPTNRAP